MPLSKGNWKSKDSQPSDWDSVSGIRAPTDHCTNSDVEYESSDEKVDVRNMGGGLTVLQVDGSTAEDARPSFLVFFIAAAIIRQRRAVLNSASSDDVMRHFLQAKVDMWPTIIRARGLRADMFQGSKKRI
jgi:hypothetical protein